MERGDIDYEVRLHLKRVQSLLYADFDKRTHAAIAAVASETGSLPPVFEKKIVRAGLFFELIEQQYVGPLTEYVNKIKALFTRHQILFRLYDITHCKHGYERLSLIWYCHGSEYIFDFIFDSSQHNPSESYYRLGLISGCGELLDGDILHGSGQLLEDGKDLPQWFISGLKANA